MRLIGLSPQGRRPRMGSRSGWKTGGPHYIFAIGLLGSRAPENKVPVGNYHCAGRASKLTMQYHNSSLYILKQKKKITKYRNTVDKNKPYMKAMHQKFTVALILRTIKQRYVHSDCYNTCATIQITAGLYSTAKNYIYQLQQLNTLRLLSAILDRNGASNQLG
jgi:hypothetical protein